MVPILAINCAVDTERRARFGSAAKGANLTFIDAIDARQGAAVFKPYLHLLRDRFWLSDDIKPGAFACFISHRLAWQHVVDNKLPRAVIAEDDSTISSAAINIPTHDDLVFVNDRAVSWVPSGVLQNLLTPPEDTPRAIGGDGYILTLKGAKTLLKKSDSDGIRCGVDWYLAYAGLDTKELKHRDVKAVSEVKKIWKLLGGRSPILKASVSKEPLLNNNEAFYSSIGHSQLVDIKSFKQDVENA